MFRRGEADLEAYAKRFDRYYKSGRIGLSFDQIPAELIAESPHLAKVAFDAGVRDAKETTGHSFTALVQKGYTGKITEANGSESSIKLGMYKETPFDDPMNRRAVGEGNVGISRLNREDKIKLEKWKYKPDINLYLKHKKVFDNPRYYDQSTGEIIWPQNDGFVVSPIDEVLQPGFRIDRYGSDMGFFVAPEGTPYEMRAVAPGTDSGTYSVFEVLKPMSVKSGKIASWFDEAGGGIQYLLPESVDELLEAKIIRRIR